ncbi:MAG: MBL fold metallo-hydrolase [Oscillospiraceae bacterium]|nr:MBL fold metallo-hydrolase [Oscillospiraceae bacterium]
MLLFFGHGHAFSEEQNSAFFTDGNDLVLVDHSMYAFHRLKRIGADKLTESGRTENIYVIITHTHSDHVGGIPLLVHYAYYVWHIPVTVAVPSAEVAENMLYYLDKIEGCDRNAYRITDASGLKWVKNIIPTEHAPSLKGKCFGYEFEIDGRKVVYTGDTTVIEPFLPYIDSDTYFYTETSVRRSVVHLCIYDIIDKLKTLSDSGTKVFLMHLDDEEQIRKIIKDTKISVSPIYTEQ